MAAARPRLQLQQTHNLVMTPQLRLAIRILQMTSAEVNELVEQELLDNPLLTRVEDAPFPAERPAPDQTLSPPKTSAFPDSTTCAADTLIGDAALDTEPATIAEGAGFDDTWTTESAPRDWRTTASLSGDTMPDPPAALSLHDRLAEQLRLTVSFSPVQKLIGAALLADLDPAGRLCTVPVELARMLDVSHEDLEVVRHLMMTQFDPPGLFATSLRECLAAQLAARNHLDPAMEILLDHLDLIAHHKTTQLPALCGVDEADLADMLTELQHLDPKPGFEPDRLGMIVRIPDVIVRQQPDGVWRVDLNDEALPRLRIDTGLQQRAFRSLRANDKGFLKEKISHASWLLKALEQKERTLLKVAREIMRRQAAFLEHGAIGLVPLTMREIAEETGLHESTVSRATAGKYVATPRGLLEMKYFFTTALKGQRGKENHSAEAIRFRIRRLIDAEDRTAVLSDDDIVRNLRKEGVDIARRTVAKYREALHIESSVQRKRKKAASA
ncbi:RNA polymerase factor sigma-54 [Acetobacter estunensis]|uniref:RNA polymerase sigma-54 factor n=1 Tax=Acetobacter estunensis TaxID=104097 RepID=A0A967B339_9PROT|nr:RNA polymerase factor sigma-54 [Acetobacter estunensis]NHO52842.1 RNA polymerase factor sigma-54 [Acetobacter estunensis]